MDTRKLSSFIIAVGIILATLGGGNWAMVENKANQANEFRNAMRDAEIDRVKNMPETTLRETIKKQEAELRLLERVGSDLEMLSMGYVRTTRKDHTISYSLIIGGIIVLVIGIGMRVSSSKKPDAEEAV